MKARTHILGIDIAKLKFDVHLRPLAEAGPRQTATFANTPKGFQALQQWLATHAPQVGEHWHACLESTSRYGDALAAFLYGQGHQVSLVNPRRTHHYAQSRLTRTVNDPIDAGLIADFCASEDEKLARWEPRSPEHRQLQDFTRARQSLLDHRDGFANLLESASGLIRQSFQRQIQHLEKEIQRLEQAIQEFLEQTPQLKHSVDLADSVTGVGLITAATVVAELPPVDKIPQANQAIALFGLDPIKKTSGTSVDTPPRLSKMGSWRGRKALYMPAMVALRWNPIIRELGQRLRQKGRSGKYIIAAAMRKLLRLIYGVMKTGQPFDPQWHTRHAPTTQPVPVPTP